MKKRLVLNAIIMFLFTLSIVHAVDVTYTVVQGDVLPGESPQFLISVLNNEKDPITITLRSVDLNWILDQENQRFTIPKNSKKDITVTYKPFSAISPGSYAINLFVNTETSRFEKVLPANVIAFDKVVQAEFKPAAVIDPRRGAILKLNLINQHLIKLENLKLELEGPHFEVSKDLTLEKEETKIIEIPVTLPENTVEDSYSLRVTLTQEENILIDSFLPYKVAAYEDVKELIQPDERFLYGGATVTRTNLGNSLTNEVYSKKFSLMAYLLASFDPEPTRVVKEDGMRNVIWEFPLRPGQDKTVKYAINYRLPTLIIILLIIAAGAYHIFRKKNAIVLTKKVLAMHGEEGSLHVVKVVIVVRNRGNLTVHNVRVMDKVPDVLKAPTQYGSLKPNYVKPQPGYTSMVWELINIPAGQERIISYRLVGKQQVLGNITLPQSKAQYTYMGRRILAMSSSVSLKGRKGL